MKRKRIVILDKNNGDQKLEEFLSALKTSSETKKIIKAQAHLQKLLSLTFI